MLPPDLRTLEPGALSFPSTPQPWEEGQTIFLKAKLTEEETHLCKEGSLLRGTQLGAQSLCTSPSPAHLPTPALAHNGPPHPRGLLRSDCLVTAWSGGDETGEANITFQRRKLQRP